MLVLALVIILSISLGCILDVVAIVVVDRHIVDHTLVAIVVAKSCY